MFLKPGDTVELRPNGEKTKPVYELRAPLVYDRVDFEAALSQRGARHHGIYGLLRAMRRDVESNLIEAEDDERRRLIEQIDRTRAAYEAFGALAQEKASNPGADDAAIVATAKALEAAWNAATAEDEELAGVAALLRTAGGRYAAACVETTRYDAAYGIEAARIFLVGWEGPPLPFARGKQGVSDSLLALVPPAHLQAIGARVKALLAPDEETVKNSAGPSPGASGRKPSTARKTQAKKARSRPRTAAPTGGTSPTSNSGDASTRDTSSALN